jgi:hypothetical protein
VPGEVDIEQIADGSGEIVVQDIESVVCRQGDGSGGIRHKRIGAASICRIRETKAFARTRNTRL